MEYKTKQPEDLSPIQRLGRWLGLKQYQIEVTFGVYMFTPTEKFIFWSVVFLLSALTVIAVTLYLPQHILFILHRAWFYVNGGEGGSGSGPGPDIVAVKRDALSLSLRTTAAAAAETAKSVVKEL
ncbi:hypothetical protein GGR56DRAFT_678371 [Xylariaceae sp. FL0804]|nr:hypothetical protein GGR56DRAFT_678371 [Xylariaceae sp. FL0804]